MLKDRYASASRGNYDLYVVFTERAFSFLNKDGVLGYILPHKFFQSEFGAVLEIISQKKELSKKLYTLVQDKYSKMPQPTLVFCSLEKSE
ncbi:MAG: Eco57I restriction-modification methylase domain-containing protein [Ignavibacteriales bacterium]|nr:Eco57I restriction-modification methylase domain-containing protein [Ignavibacteriales bacterium]